MEVTLTRLVVLSSIGESTRNGVDHTSNLLGRILFLWRLSITCLLAVSLSLAIFCFVPSSIRVVIPVLILLVSSESRSSLVVVQPINKLG